MTNNIIQHPKVSIIVPVYEVEPYLDRCVESIARQTYDNIEVILVDDGSPDDCPRMCDAWALKDARIKVIHKENGGLSDARNAGLDAAVGDFVLFVDSDDYIEPDACEKLVPFAVADDADVVIGDAMVHRNGRTHYMRHRKEIEGTVMSGADFLKSEMPLRKANIPVVLRLYRRSFLVENGLYNKKGRIHEDYDFTPRMLIKARRVVYSGVCFYHYAIRGDSISKRTDLSSNAEHISLTCQELAEMAKGLEDRELARIIDDFIVKIYLNIFQTAKLHDSESGLLIDKKFLKGKAMTRRNRLKVRLFLYNEKLYYAVNRLYKRVKKELKRRNLWKSSTPTR